MRGVQARHRLDGLTPQLGSPNSNQLELRSFHSRNLGDRAAAIVYAHDNGIVAPR